MSLPKYLQLVRHIRNWPVYFQRKHEKNLSVRYRTAGNNFMFDVPPRFYEVFREIFMENFYRIGELVKRLPEKPVVVDIGGNVGFFSFLLASKKPKSTIYAYEPMKENAAIFNDNIDLNTTQLKGITVFNKAVTGNHNGHIDIFFDGGNSVISSVIKDFAVQNDQVKRVEAISLEKIFADHNLDNIDLLKIDCEGSEYPIFYDSPAGLFDRVQMIAIETHELDTQTRNTKALTRFLEEKGFTIDTFMAENHCHYLKAYRK